jgi:uncharacterized protein
LNPLFSHWNFRSRAVWFLLSTFLLGSIAVFVGAFVLSFFAGSTVDKVLEVGQDLSNPSSRTVLLILSVFNQLGAFVLSVWAFFKMFGPEGWLHTLKRKPRFSALLLGGMLAVVFLPLLEASLSFNDLLAPEGSWLHGVLKETEERSRQLYETLLRLKSPGDVLIAIVIAALIPAIGEELAFRGVLQGLIGRSTRNMHAAVWISALIFSLYHMQFYGFIPRMLLGAMFGYLTWWSGSVWAGAAAHFINNLITVLAYYLIMERELLTEESVENLGSNPLWMGISVVGVAGVLYWFYRNKVAEEIAPPASPLDEHLPD